MSGPRNGTVALQEHGHMARFQPGSGFRGVSSFSFTVTGSDGSAYTNEVVLAAPARRFTGGDQLLGRWLPILECI